jgi:hypothetical protein
MLTKIFRKSDTDDTPAAAPKPTSTPASDAAQAAEKAEWERRLQAASGDDAALLAIAREAPVLEIRLAAVEGLTGETSLKTAEREFRNQNRRVHRIAKQRYEALMARREARAQGRFLIDTGRALLHEAVIPANRLVELDQAWRALDPSLLDEALLQEYASVREELTTVVRARGDDQIASDRWSAQAQQALATLAAKGAEAVAGTGDRAAMVEAREGVQAALSTAPATAAETDAGLVAALSGALEEAIKIESRLALLDALAHAAPATNESGAAEARQQWAALPPVADARIARALETRLEEHLKSASEESATRDNEARTRAREQNKAAHRAKLDALAEKVSNAEAALAAGQLAELGKHITAIEDTVRAASPGPALQLRIDTLRNEYNRLRDWQRWGGGRVRDELVEAAEALARASTETKVSLKEHGEAIEKLRQRWKEVDRLGGATSQALWQRFDAALKTAHQPVEAHLQKLKAAREENLETRRKLVAGLDAFTLPDPPNWREVARTLDQFNTDWRKLGPIEHTVPHKARDALLAQMKASMSRLDAPLSEARRGAQAEREKLVERAKSLGTNAKDRDIVTKVKALQAEWQQHAKTLPLERNVENSLWTAFRGATDAIFNERDAAFKARDAQFKAHAVAREALIERLRALTADTPPSDIRRALSEVENEWRKAGEAPRAEAGKLDSAYRQAREAASGYLANSAQRGWQLSCDALSAKLTLVEAAEEQGAASDATAQWGASAALPAAWEAALQARLKALEEGGPGGDGLDTALLQLESIFDVASPAEYQNARRELKLRQLQQAWGTRQAREQAETDPEKLLSTALAHSRPSAQQRDRLHAIIAAVRAKGLRGTVKR